MSEFKDVKIEDEYKFYLCLGCADGTAEKNMTVKEITGVESQEQFEKLDEKYIEKCFQEECERFLNNLDFGWHKV